MTSFLEVMEELSGKFPLGSSAAATESQVLIGIPLANRAVDAINKGKIASIRSSLNPLNIEYLVATAMDRIVACMTLRDKAHALQIMAFSESLEYRLHSEILPLQAELDKLRNDIDDDNKADANAIIEKILDYNNMFYESKKIASSDPGNAAHYAERYDFLIELFDINIRQAFARSQQLSLGMKMLYDIDRPVPELAGHLFLNNLAVWLQESSDQIDAILDKQFEYRSSFSLCSGQAVAGNQIFNQEDFNAKLNAKIFNFSISSNDCIRLNIIDRSKIKDMWVQVYPNSPGAEGHSKLCWNMKLRLPGSTLSVPFVAGTGDVGQFNLGNVANNLSPFGEWVISVDSTSITGSTQLIGNIAVHLSLIANKS